MKAFIKSLKRPGNETLIEAILKGYDAIFEDQIKGGKADKKKSSDFDPEQLKMGIEVEQEHTDDKKLAKEIAMDHLTEFPTYYTELKKMEKKLEKDAAKKPSETDPEEVKIGDEILERVFVYKTLMDENVRKKLLKRDVKIKKDKLLDYTKIDEGNGYYTLSYSKGSVVKGDILFVTKSELKKLDDWEDRYNRVEEDLESGDKAWAYVEKKKYTKKNLTEAIGPVYHGTNDKFEKFDLDKTTMGDIWFSSNRETIERGESGARGTKYIMERYLNIPEEKLAGWDLYEKRGLCELRNMGYRGVKLPSEEGTDYIVFNPKDIIKKPKNIMESIGPVYHGSPNKFDRFSYDYMGKIGTSEGYGFYFTTDKSIAEKYSEGTGNVYTAYLDINKPLNPTKKTITKTQLLQFIKALDPTGQDYLSNWGDVTHEGYDNTLRKAVDTEYKYNNNDVDLISSIINADGSGPENVYSILTKTLGYDGIVAQPDWVGGGHKIVIPFSPDQIKLVK